MSRYERTGKRDLAYSAWHRTLRDDCTYIDLDSVEYCPQCHEILFVAEVCFDNGEYKPTTITRLVAEGLGVPGLLIQYQKDAAGGVSAFRVRRIAPTYTNPVVITPRTLGDWIERQHDEHVCTSTTRKAA